MLRKQRRIILALSFFISSPSFAIQYLPTPNIDVSSSYFNAFPYDPRASVWGYEGTRGLGEADVMVPIAGNSDNIIYLDPEGKYASNDTYSSGIGLGFRHVIEQSHIIGAYVFGDYSNAIYNQHFWDINPGIEWMGNLWDFRGNGYIPISNRSRNVGNFFGDQIGIFKFVSFQGHTQYDHIFNVSDEIGPGMDVEVGRVIPGLNKVRAYVGGYYFSPSDANNIRGIEGRVEYNVNHYVALEATDTYDNLQHNAALLGVRLTVGGLKEDEASYPIQARLLDPIPRNMATIYTGNAVPVVRTARDITPINNNIIIENNGIYFFNANSGSVYNPALGANNCTFANPCIGTSFTNTTLSDISIFTPNASMYLSPGNYSPDTPFTPLNLINGQSVFGRNANFSQPAIGSNRPLISSSFTLNGNNTLDSIQLINDGTEQIGVLASGVSNINLSNDLIGGNSVSQSYPSAAIDLVGVTGFNIIGSDINGFDNTGHGGLALDLVNDHNGNVSNDAISYTDTSTTPIVAESVAIGGGSNNTITNTVISISSTAPNSRIVGLSDTLSSIILNGDTIDASIMDPAATSTNASTIGMSISGAGTSATINNSNISASFSGGSTSPYNNLVLTLKGMSFVGSGPVTLKNSIISANAIVNANTNASLNMQITGIDASSATITGSLDTINASGTEMGATTGATNVTAIGVNSSGGTNSLDTNTTIYNVSVVCPAGTETCSAFPHVP